VYAFVFAADEQLVAMQLWDRRAACYARTDAEQYQPGSEAACGSFEACCLQTGIIGECLALEHSLLSSLGVTVCATCVTAEWGWSTCIEVVMNIAYAALAQSHISCSSLLNTQSDWTLLTLHLRLSSVLICLACTVWPLANASLAATNQGKLIYCMQKAARRMQVSAKHIEFAIYLQPKSSCQHHSWSNVQGTGSVHLVLTITEQEM